MKAINCRNLSFWLLAITVAGMLCAQPTLASPRPLTETAEEGLENFIKRFRIPGDSQAEAENYLFGEQYNRALSEVITRHNLTGYPAAGRLIPKISDPKAQLGMRLYFSKALGGERDVACVTCHHPLLGGGDDLALSIGVGAVVPDLLGPGRKHPSGKVEVPRNATSIFNLALYDQVLFWDGRVESLTKTPFAQGSDGGIRTPDSNFGEADPDAGKNLTEAQAAFPVTSHEEMRGSRLHGESNSDYRDFLVRRLQGEGEDPLAQPEYWIQQFKAVYGEPEENQADSTVITKGRLNEVLSVYELSQTFVNSPWSDYVRGNHAAISSSAKRGALLFFRPVSEGGANCVACHTGDKFSDEGFHNIAAPQIGHGGRGGVEDTGDEGRWRESGDSDDQFAFRTPTLLNIEGTGPYTHSGAYLTLEEVVRHHLNPEAALANFDTSRLKQLQPGIETEHVQENTQLALVALQQAQSAGHSKLERVSLTDAQVDDLVSFLRSLTDPCVKSADCLAPWMPPLGEDPNGLQLDPLFDIDARVE